MSENPKAMSRQSRKVLVDDFEAFLRVGMVSYAEWSELDTDEKACLLLARRRIDIQNTITTARAMNMTEEEELLLVSEVDGGDALVGRVIDKAIANWQAKRSRTG